MGQLMNIVGPLLLLGGAVYVFSKRCELLGLCGETTADSGVLPEADATPSTDTTTSTSSTTGAKKSGCCTCSDHNGKVKCHTGDGNWFNPPAGPDGSNDTSVELSLKECNKQCGSSSSNSTNGAGASAGARAGASIPKTPRLQASGSASAGAGVGGSKKSSSSSNNKKSTGGAGTGAGAKVGASFYSLRRSYFVDPYYVRPFTLYHRIAN